MIQPINKKQYMKKQKCKEVLIKKSISVNQQKNFMYNQKHKEIIEKNRI